MGRQDFDFKRWWQRRKIYAWSAFWHYYYTLCAIIKMRYMTNIRVAGAFLKLAGLALRGKITIISSRETFSNGGFRYLAITISKLPFSADHTYEDL